ncbi:RNA polymerase sigma factor [Winogradskyella sp. UBA3174]|uniref:RNA polymerase sigma factor n=1 Tax=Winogradskyella sp. UBA3174 TaxID=1947785 RepID=UPI0025DD177C|nr:sigma-70 family RNA polymerase sigma factor [Winogradskyella sp. UBA3174]|tara:strand:- start:37613 stop:38125 length:513 start_codon:yes stop_codon:yes gene_type:complete
MSKDNRNICNSKTFEFIYKTYAKDIRRFLFFKTQDIDAAEDLLQNTFIKLWDNCSKVDYNKIKSYTYTVANNLFLNEKKHEKVVKNYSDSNKKESTNESPEFILLEKEFMEKLERTISNLPEKQREVFLLNRIENKKYKEIAELLDISVKAVEKRMHQALVVMRKEIGNV